VKNNTICFFNSAKVWGGGEKWHHEISTGLYVKGYSTVVITNKKSELFNSINLTGQKVYAVKISNLSFLNPFKVFSLKKLFLKEKIDIIIINLSADLKVAGIAAKLAGIKKIIYRRGSAIPVRNRWLNRFIFKNIVTGIISNSEDTKRTILQNNARLFAHDKIKVIYNGIDIKKYDLDTKRKLFVGSNDEIILGNVGRLVHQKGQRYLIDIASELHKKSQKFKILIGGEGPLKKELVLYAQRLNVAGHIVFLGFINDIVAFMNSIDIFILTSLWEGFGYVITEAMLCHKPVVAFNVSSNPELIEDSKTGFLAEFNNIPDFTRKLTLLINDNDLRVKQGKQGHIRVKSHFTIDKAVKEVENYLNSLKY
jgi:glycosyltransferase involved in cell wall biosynthesis